MFILVCGIQIAVNTGVLAGALLVTGEEEINSHTLLKCLGITVAAFVLAFFPFGGLLAGVLWFGALMAAFEKTFVEAILIAVVCMVISAVVKVGLDSLVATLT